MPLRHLAIFLLAVFCLPLALAGVDAQTVSSLPPELYIFHTYQNPGTYSCELTITTVDGRSQTFRQGVVVKAAGD